MHVRKHIAHTHDDGMMKLEFGEKNSIERAKSEPIFFLTLRTSAAFR
jgi:hypothetical protein